MCVYIYVYTRMVNKSVNVDHLDELDLDLTNYDLPDLLNLFNLSDSFTKQELKTAKNIALKMHPDKSGLDSKYFLFYSKAYKTVFELWSFRCKSEMSATEADTEYTDDVAPPEYNKELLTKMFAENKQLNSADGFNKWFNREFDKTNVVSEVDGKGYGEWMSGTDNNGTNGTNDNNGDNGDNGTNKGTDWSSINTGQIPLEQMQSNFMERKVRARQDMVLHQEVGGWDIGGGGSLIADDGASPFDSGLGGSGLCYQDLRKAHTETVIPMTDEDMFSERRFDTVEDMKSYRASQLQTMEPASGDEYFAEKRRRENEDATQRAFRLAKESEVVETKSRSFWQSLRLLGNNVMG